MLVLARALSFKDLSHSNAKHYFYLKLYVVVV